MAPLADRLMLIVRAELPRDFLLRLADEMDAAYAASKRESDARTSGRPLYTRRLGQTRHFEREEALMRAAQATELAWVDARPRGYPKVFVETPRLRLAELKVQTWGDLPVSTQERRSLAASNPLLGSFAGQGSLLADESIGEKMLAYIVVANPDDVDNELPSKVGVGIPNANLDDWAFLASLEAILTLDVAVNDTPRLIDRARPVLKVVHKQEDGKK